MDDQRETRSYSVRPPLVLGSLWLAITARPDLAAAIYEILGMNGEPWGE
jgi:hypothetical protein